MNNKRVYIIIVNYLNWQDTKDCIGSILLSSYSNFSVIVIDNNSGNRSLEMILENLDKTVPGINPDIVKTTDIARGISDINFPGLLFIQNDCNAGFAKANNLVLDFIRNTDSYVWLLNPDMIIEENTLQQLVSFAEAQPVKSIIGATVKSYTGNRELLFYGGGKINSRSATVSMTRDIREVKNLDYISGASLFTHAANFKTMGLLPTDYFLYWEETDWCYNARQQGFLLTVCEEAVCYDKVSTVIGRGFKSDYYYARNGLLFISKYKKSNLAAAICFTLLRYMKRILSGNFSRAAGIRRGVMDYLKGKKDEAE